MSYGLCAENVMKRVHATQLACDTEDTQRKSCSLLHWPTGGSPSSEFFLD